MFDCCPNKCSSATEFPKQRGPYVEPKFSKYDPPSFLCNTDPPKPRAKTRSCSCSSKFAKVSINCQCQAKGITDCRKIGKDGRRVCEKSCGVTDKGAADNESPEGIAGKATGAQTPGTMESERIAGNVPGARAPGMNAEYPPGMMGNGPANAIWQGAHGSPITLDNGVNPGIPVYDLTAQGYPMNPSQMPQQLSEMPAAGLPTRQIPPFDPCTGRERIAPEPVAPYGQPGQIGAFGMPMTCMYPCYCQNQCYPCPPAMNVCPPMQQGFGQPTNAMQTNNFNDKETSKENGEKVDKTNSRSTSRDRSERSKDGRNKSRLPDSAKSSVREREIAKASRPNRKDYPGAEIINCGSASPELIRRICDSLQGPRPPDSCYIVLPITMSSKAKDDQPEKKAKKKPDLESSHPSVEDAFIPAEEEPQKTENPLPPPASKPTRNCGCNTLITGKFEEKTEKPKDSSAKNSCNPGTGACCSSGCCYRPCYTYCYNPCTGCFYWRKKCCCCSCSNGCCNNNGGSCPMPKPASSVGTPSGSKGANAPVGSPPATKRPPTDIAKGMSAANSASDQRFAAGAMSAFQPGVQELYDQWVGFQQHAVFPPMMPPRQQPPFVNRSLRSQSSRARDEPKYRSPDFDWTPQ